MTVRLGKTFAGIRVDGEHIVAGAGAPGIAVASAARDAGLGGLEFLRGIPGTVGGAVRMNAGAYGREVADCLIEATVVRRDGSVVTLSAADLGFSYRHSALADGDIVVAALFRATPGDRTAIAAEMDRIAAEREASQPLRSRTGGSTFANPPGHKAWALIDAAGCRGLTRGGAQVSEKHTNFLINTGDATSADLEGLGDEVRARVLRAQRRRPALGNRPGGAAMKVVVLMGGWSAEREVSLTSGAGIAAACRRLGHDVTEIDMARDVAARLLAAAPDVVFNALHGSPGEDGTVQGMLDLLGLKYTHSGVATSAIAIDKELTKALPDAARHPHAGRARRRLGRPPRRATPCPAPMSSSRSTRGRASASPSSPTGRTTATRSRRTPRGRGGTSTSSSPSRSSPGAS